MSLKLSYQGDNGDLETTSPNPLHSSPPQLVASDSAIFPRQVSPTSFALPSPENTNQAHTQRPFRRQTGHVQRAAAKKEMIGIKKSVVAKAAGFYRLLPTCRHPLSVSTLFRGKNPPQVAAAMRNTPGIARELLNCSCPSGSPRTTKYITKRVRYRGRKDSRPVEGRRVCVMHAE